MEIIFIFAIIIFLTYWLSNTSKNTKDSVQKKIVASVQQLASHLNSDIQEKFLIYEAKRLESLEKQEPELEKEALKELKEYIFNTQVKDIETITEKSKQYF